MSKGGGSQQSTTTQTIPAWMQSDIQSNYAAGQAVASTPYTPYTGEGVAPMNATENQGVAGIQAAQGAGLGAVQAGQAAVGNAAGYTPQNVSYAAPTSAQISSYESPYASDVVNTTNQQIAQQNQQAIEGNGSQQVAQGAYGGSRSGVQNALTNQYYAQTTANTDAQLNNQNYSQALGEANTVNSGNLQANEANQSAGLTANGQQIQAGAALGALGQAQSGIQLGGAEGLLNAGEAQQQTQNATDQFNYNQYEQQLMWPYQQQQALTGSLYGGNVGSTTTQPVYQNNIASGIGTGLGAAGLISSLGGSGGESAGGGLLAGVGSMFSDKNAKTDKAPVDAEAAADKIASMPIDTWRYKPGIGMGDAEHMGTYAQDFAKNFGGDGHSISIIDAIGATMAGVKGLSKKIDRLERRAA